MDSNETRHWYKLPVPLEWLCKLDEQPAENALEGAFGDRYLYRHNPIFRRIRDAVINLGYSFSCADSDSWRDYQSFPLTTLDRILQEKTIPYLDTSASVRRMLNRLPGASLSPGFIASTLRHNHAYHESAHCVAHQIVSGFADELQQIAPDVGRRFVLAALFAESFANTVERLGSVVQDRPVSDTMFYAINSYVSPGAGTKAALDEAVEHACSGAVFTMLYLAAFEANLTRDTPSDGICLRIAHAAECLLPDDPVFKRVVDVGFDLSAGFRDNTNAMYFGFLGYGKAYAALAQSAWLGEPGNSALVRRIASALFATMQEVTR